MEVQVPDVHQALVMHVAPVERGGIHLPPKKQNSLMQSESPTHSTQRPLSQIVASPRVQSELAVHVCGLGGLGGLCGNSIEIVWLEFWLEKRLNIPF